jgi:5-(carboxyamino)imidazole ribonucleotide mutase
MPQGVPVATVAIGNSRNAGLLAVRILAASDPNLQQQMIAYQAEMAIASRKKNIALRDQQIGG